jgi:hypothetical protein
MLITEKIDYSVGQIYERVRLIVNYYSQRRARF